MTLQEWRDKNIGKPLDWDGQYGAQCVDACRYYVKDVLNYEQFDPVVGASEIFDKAQTELYEKVENTPDGIPPYGAIIIWKKTSSLPYGHVAICFDKNADVNKFKSLDQNWSAQKLTEESHGYTGIRGWLIPKSMDGNDWLIHNSDQWRGLIWYLEIKTDPEHTDLSTVKSICAGYKSRITDLENQVNNLNSDLAKASVEIKNQIDKLANVEEKCQRETRQIQSEYQALKDTIPSIEKLRGSYQGVIDELEGKLREAQKMIGLKDIEIAELKGEVEVVSWIDKIINWIKNRYK